MAGMSDDEHLSFAVLAVCDALEQQDDTRARESLNKARKHAYAVINRNRPRATPPVCLCQPDRRPECGCTAMCVCDSEIN